jgi:hypothetical protein
VLRGLSGRKRICGKRIGGGGRGGVGRGRGRACQSWCTSDSKRGTEDKRLPEEETDWGNQELGVSYEAGDFQRKETLKY